MNILTGFDVKGIILLESKLIASNHEMFYDVYKLKMICIYIYIQKFHHC